MPKGKGTYGSKVGRPPKKYQEGGTTGQTEAVMDAAQKGQELKSISLENIPTQNAPDRNEMSPIGGEVGTGMYKEGGKVREWQKNPKDTKFKAKFPKQTFKGKEVKPVPLPKDVSKQYFKGKEIKPAKGFYAKSDKKGKKGKK